MVNPVAEAKLVPHAHHNNGSLDFIALKNHYKGVGFHAINIFQADKILQDIFYSGEKKPHMWWDEFERKFTDAFNTYGCRERRNVHLENQKLRILNRKINADFLWATKASIKFNISKTPVTLNYYDSLTAFRNQVNQNFLPELSSSNNRITRGVNEVGSRGGGRVGRF